ncbi:MAG: hypothetical protein ACFFB2_09725 [Promethearchaeota archaeon]
MKSKNMLSLILVIFFSFLIIFPFYETTAKSNQRLLPFIGMVVNYKLNVKIEGIPFPVTANWTVTWEQYNVTAPSVFISNLTVKSTYITFITFVDRESGIIIENRTSREVLFINLTDTTFLQILYDLYFSPDRRNYSPFYIDPTDMSIGDHINVYSFNMTVVATDRVSVADFGWRNVWIVQTKETEENVEHFISLIYDNRTGLLVGGRIFTRWFWSDGSQRRYDVKIICQNTNALNRYRLLIETNRVLIILVSCIPFLPLFVKILRLREIEGGL